MKKTIFIAGFIMLSGGIITAMEYPKGGAVVQVNQNKLFPYLKNFGQAMDTWLPKDEFKQKTIDLIRYMFWSTTSKVSDWQATFEKVRKNLNEKITIVLGDGGFMKDGKDVSKQAIYDIFKALDALENEIYKQIK